MPRAKQRTPQLRDHVVEVALRTLASDGVGGFTTRRIACKARTSTPAIYELFGDKPGLIREVFFEGFRLLRRCFDALEETGDPRRDLLRLFDLFRGFLQANPELSEVMFSRPFADFDPGPPELEAGSAVRGFIVAQVRRAIDAGVLAGDETDIAHVLMSLTLGLAGAESARRLGASKASVDRRWALALDAMVDGLAPNPSGRSRPGAGR